MDACLLDHVGFQNKGMTVALPYSYLIRDRRLLSSRLLRLSGQSNNPKLRIHTSNQIRSNAFLGGPSCNDGYHGNGHAFYGE